MAEFTPINSQEELDKVLASRLQRERETVSKQFQTQIEERDQKITGFETQITDLNKQIETFKGQTAEIEDLKAKVKGYETSSVKMRIAREVGLPAELADRLSGEDEKTIRADAEALEKVFKRQGGTAPLYQPNGEGGADKKETALRSLLSEVRNQ